MNEVSEDIDTKIVLAYIKYLTEDRLRKGAPGMLIALNSLAMKKYGVYVTELLVKNPKGFIDVLNTYFRNQDTAQRFVRYLLKPLIEAGGEDGRRAVEALINGDRAEFTAYSVKVLKDRAKKWFKS